MKAKVKIMYGPTLLGEKGEPLPFGRPDPAVLVEIQKVLEDVVYRDWEWHLYLHGEMVQLASIFTVEDSEASRPIQLVFFGGSIPANREMMYHDMPVERLVVDTAWRAVKEFALHEAAEWFRYKGVMIHDPHKEERERAIKPADLTGEQCPR